MAGDSCRAASCGTSEGSCFTALRQSNPWSYLRSTGCHRQSGGPGDVDRRVDVPIQPYSTPSALPGTDAKSLRAVFGAAGRAHLGGGLKPADPVEAALISLGLVLQHAHERRPSGVVYRLSHVGAAESFHRQILYGDRLVFADQRRGELMVELAPRIGHLRMHPGDPAPSPLLIPAAFLLAGQRPLRPSKFLLRPP